MIYKESTHICGATHFKQAHQALTEGPVKSSVDSTSEAFTKGQELRSFLFLSVVMAPVLAVMIVGGYGFLVWIFQMFTGPPGS
ncbi:nitrate reductase, NapE protein [Variovorax sp. OV329]|jgi:periplasmic nitrate reductase NapE|nr:nitrate reductase, NapE protein [Variovorax sp. OV329]